MVEALKKTNGDTDTEKLIAAMEGMSFETPKGKMTFRKEDHQAMQAMYHFKHQEDPGVRVGRARAGARDPGRGDADPDPQQALSAMRSRTRARSGVPGRRDPVLETRDLTIRFGGHVAVERVSLRASSRAR